MSGQPLVKGGEATRSEGCPGVKEALPHGSLPRPRRRSEIRAHPTPRLAGGTGAHLLSITIGGPPVTLGTSVGSSGVASSVPPPPGLFLLGVGARKPRSCESHPSKNGEGLPWDVLRDRPGLSHARLQSHPVCPSPVRTPAPSSQHRAEGVPWQTAQPGLGLVCWLHPREQPQPLETLLQLTGTGVRRPAFDGVRLRTGRRMWSAELACFARFSH